MSGHGADQYRLRRVLENKAVRQPRPLLGVTEAAAWVRRAAQDERRLERARELWSDVAPAGWQGRSRVVGVEEGVVMVEVSAPEIQERVRREAASLVRRLAARWSAIRGLRVVRPGEGRDQGGGETCR